MTRRPFGSYSCFVVAALLPLVCSCTAIDVDPLPPDVTEVAIVHNNKVLVDDFVPVMRAALERRGIHTTIVANESASGEKVMATYTALRSWDLASYLSTADVWFWRDGQQIARLHYHLIGKGGLSLAKWESTEAKLTSAYDELLEAYSTTEEGGGR